MLSASKSYSERLFRYQRIDRLARDAADLALTAPAAGEEAAFTADALAAMYAATGGYPYFVQAYGKAVWDRAPRSPITVDDVRSRRPRRSPSSPSASSARATSAPRRGSGSTSGPWRTSRRPRTIPRSTRSSPPTSPPRSAKKPQSLSPARDALLKKGLIYSGERGRIAFTVPHFGRYLREHAG